MVIDKSINEYTFNDRDEFNRKSIADNIYSLIYSNIDISPLIINGDWGVGKTEFCYKTINLIKNKSNDNKINTIYIDAFKYDHIEQPLITIISEILKELKKLNSESHKENYKKLLTKAAQVSAFFLKTGGKAVVSHLLKQNFNTIDEDFKKVIEECEDAFSQYAATAIKSHIESEKNIEDLRNILKNIAKENKLIIFIDELDRCKPSYALSMLEVIKHIFNIEGICIVLVTNLEQLKSSVKHAYGSQINSDKYLEKFSNFTITLPYDIKQSSHSNWNISSHSSFILFDNLMKDSKLIDELFFQHEQGCEYILIPEFIKNNNPSLRSVERLVRHIEIYLAIYSAENAKINFGSFNIIRKMMTIFGILVCVFRTDLSSKIERDSASIDDIYDFLGFKNEVSFKSFISSNYSRYDYLLFSLLKRNLSENKDIIPDDISQYISSHYRMGFDINNKNFFTDIKAAISVFRGMSLS